MPIIPEVRWWKWGDCKFQTSLGLHRKKSRTKQNTTTHAKTNEQKDD